MRPSDLPIFELEEQIVVSLRKEQRLIIQAPTGSGKSTQVPQILLEHDLLAEGEVVVLQPRRLAARMLAARVAFERKARLGDEVGYQIRFENVTSPRTRIRFVTEGVLLRQMLENPELPGVAAILFDEFHERHLYGDITLARALDLQAKERPDLRLAVMSATLDPGPLQKFLSPARVLTSSGRQHPVETEYLSKPAHDYPVWDLAADELERLASRTEGDVLIFMPGKYEIGRTINAVAASRVSHQFVTFPLHGELPPADQDAAVSPCAKRKVIVSTNVAETSLTIEGVRVVIDSGLARVARYDARRGINTLLIEKISRASAQQRAGRAGRTAPGICLRLWTEREHADLAEQELPEVKRLDLAEVALTLKASGVSDLKNFRWLESPEAHALERAETLLADLGALSEEEKKITPLGRRMLAFPVHPRYARMLIAAEELRCVPAVALIAAITQGRPLLRRAESRARREEREDLLGATDESDLFILLRAFRFAENNRFDSRRCDRLQVHAGAAREAAQLRDQFLEIAKRMGLVLHEEAPPPTSVARCVLAGFPDQVAIRLDAGTLRCAMVHGRRGVLARESAVREAKLLVASEIREIEDSSGEREILLTLATRIEESWLRELFPDAFHEENTSHFDAVQRRVVSRRRVMFHDLVLEERSSDTVNETEAAALLAREIAAGNLALPKWDHAVEQLIARINFVQETFPEIGVSRIGEEERHALLEQICLGATSYREVKERAVLSVVRGWLNHPQLAELENLAPERIKLPKGRQARITYQTGVAPTIAARIQDLYGVERHLTIGSGKIRLRLEVLAPNQRPVQVTDDLENFWRESYPKLKKELQRKYPKHEWR